MAEKKKRSKTATPAPGKVSTTAAEKPEKTKSRDGALLTRSTDRAEYRFARHWTLQAKVANLFDEQYETTSFYNQPGRTWSLMLRFQPAE